ncbi:hypothetical protein PMIN02_011760 [Paraphaeosphaeria minitans]
MHSAPTILSAHHTFSNFSISNGECMHAAFVTTKTGYGTRAADLPATRLNTFLGQQRTRTLVQASYCT